MLGRAATAKLLLSASKRGLDEDVQRLLESNEGMGVVDEVDAKGRTPLHLACSVHPRDRHAAVSKSNGKSVV